MRDDLFEGVTDVGSLVLLYEHKDNILMQNFPLVDRLDLVNRVAANASGLNYVLEPCLRDILYHQLIDLVLLFADFTLIILLEFVLVYLSLLSLVPVFIYSKYKVYLILSSENELNYKIYEVLNLLFRFSIVLLTINYLLIDA